MVDAAMADEARTRSDALRLGLLGGTFDPPHVGHIAAARCAREFARLDRVELIPACSPPHKPGRPLSSPFHRYTMAALAALAEPGMLASFRDLARGGLSYAIETLREVRAAAPGSRIFFIMGSDQFADIASWREPRAIVTEFELIVVDRRGSEFERAVRATDDVAEAHRRGRILRALMDPVDVSSTTIREKVRKGEPVEELVNARVEQYIRAYGLYGPGG